MEDQPAEPGGLTEQAAAAPQGKAARRRHRLPHQQAARAAAVSDEGAGTASDDEAADTEVTGIEADGERDAADGEQPSVVVAEFRPVGRRLIAAGVAAGVLFVGAAAFAASQLQPYLADRALVHNKFEVAQTAAATVTTLWSYTPENMDRLAQRSSRYLAPDFADQYRKFIDSIVPTNKQAQLTNETHVVGAAVENIGPNEATAIVYTNTISSSPLRKGVPSLQYLSYRLDLQRHGGGWLVNRMTALTKLDQTPQL